MKYQKLNGSSLVEKDIFPATLFIIITLVLGTGLYELKLMPKDELLVSILSICALITGYYQRKKFGFIESKILIGFILFNFFFITHAYLITPYNAEFKTYITHAMTLGAFLSSYCLCKQTLSANFNIRIIHKQDLALLISIIALGIILSTQLWQISSSPTNILLRPGGLLNPNITAALSLCFMYSAIKISRHQNNISLYITLSLAIPIILLAQSRSATLALAAYIIYILVQKKNLKLITPILVLLPILTTLLILGPDELIQLPQSFLSRFKGDASSTHRILLLQQGWAAFLESPLWGNGYRFIAGLTSVSTHNEIIEALANFGMLGLIIITLAFYYLYLPFSLIFCITCIVPTLIFTHNFFDTYAIQSAIGIALAIDRYKHSEKPTDT